MDPTKHLIYRHIIENELFIDRIKEYELKMKHIIDNLLNELVNQNSQIDFISQFAIKVPQFIIYDLLVIHQIDYEFINNRNNNSKLNNDRSSHTELSDYINRLIANKKSNTRI
jgi:cytochrome P450